MTYNEFQNLLQDSVLIGDGAMGTMLYEHGVFLNQCFEELNLTNPNLVADVHSEYVKAGSDFIETNTFAANEVKLAKYGLDSQLEAINEQGVIIAKKAAGEDVWVAGSVGPMGVEYTAESQSTKDKFAKAFERQIIALDSAGADFLIFETFPNPRELMLAVEVAGKVSQLPVVAHISPNRMQTTKYGDDLGEAIEKLSKYENVAAVGLNCGVGPVSMLESLELIKEKSLKPFSLMPNAGMPREVDGRRIYMCTPEYMAEYAKRFFEKGVRVIGGCCGSRPEHIREMAKAVKSLDKSEHYRVGAVSAAVTTEEKPKGYEPKPLAEKSLVGKKLAAGEKIYSIEIVPPRGTDVSSVVEKARLCKQYGIDAINIPDGPRASSRLSPVVTAISITRDVDIEVILHVCCRDRNLISMQSDMLGVNVLDLKNVLLVTGDTPKLGEFPDATAVFDLDSVALTGIVSQLNRGIDIAGNQLNEPLALTVSVGVNPAASDFDREMERFKRKVDAGAEYCITQPVFDLSAIERFLEAIEGYRIPVVAGIWPFASYKNAEFMANEVPGVVVPDSLLERMSKTKTKEEGRKEGVAIAREMIERLDPIVAGYTVSAPFGNVNTALAVLGRVEI